MSYSESPGPELIIQHTGQVFVLTQEAITIGRADDNSIVLSDPKVSAHHATVSWNAEINSYYIQDLGSTNGTFVNERAVEQPKQLRHGDVIRVGNTVIDLRLGPALAAVPPAEELPPVYEEETGGVSRSPLLIGILIVLLAGITLLCCILTATLLFTGDGRTPDVVIQSPADSAQTIIDIEIILQATASGAKDITQLELSVDGSLVATTTSSDPNGQSSLTITKPWIFALPGEHTVSAVARTASGKTSKTESVKVNVVSTGSETRPSSTPTPPGAGTATDTPPVEVTATATREPEATMPPPPQIEYFQANPASITSGGCTTLQWGTVSNADAAVIEPDVGGVATPGSATVCPAETTTYVLTASGPGGQSQASTVVTVVGAAADLIVDTITFDPNPAVQGQDNEVKITIRNGGNGAAGAFNWEWQAGTDARFDGRLRGLNPGETTIVTVRWTPSAAYAKLDTVARVDVNNEVPESDKGNNELWASVQVVESGAGGPGTVTLTSEAALDGYRSNDGRGSHKKDIFVGNSELSETVGEVVWRGFMSFNLSSIPSGANIENVQLRFYQAKVGGDPYTKLGSLILDHVDYGSSLDDSAFNTPALHSAVLGQQPSSGAWYVFDSPLFDEWLEQDLAAGRSRFQLRLRWQQETDGDGREDYSGIESADDFFGTGNAPQLVVSYSQ